MHAYYRAPMGCLCWLALWASVAVPAGSDSTPADERYLQENKIGTDGTALLKHLEQRTAKDVDADKIPTFIKQLGDDSFDVRENASARLTRLGRQAVPYLHDALKSTDVEVVHRAEDCLRLIRSGAGAAADTAVLRLVAVRKPAGAVEALLSYLPCAANYLVAEEVKTALTAVALRGGQPDAALLTALTDKLPLRRAAAAVALCRAGQPKPVRPLLRDADLDVRLQAALALAAAGDREAVPVLIDLLPQLTRSSAWQAEDLLFRIAGAQPPAISLGSTEAARKTCRDAWAAWWTKNGARADLGKLRPAQPALGRTMTVLLDSNLIQEMDAKGNLLWQLKGVQFPLDAQYLPESDHVLTAEHGGAKVTERDLQGKVVWEKELGDSPLVAQRLANGHTFIVTNATLLEVDKDGKEIFTYNRPPPETFRRAMKLPNGDIAIVTTAQRFVRLGPDRQEIQSMPADVVTNGGRIDVLRNGHVLVPLKDENRVVEYDADGKEIWEAAIQEPVAAVRLPNGHTLVTTLNQRRAVELDGAAREVWEYRSTESRVTRAWRR